MKKSPFQRFFNLADQGEKLIGGRIIPAYPGMAFLKFIVEWAYEAKQMPFDVYQQFLQEPRNFQLLAAYRNYKIEKENKEIEKQRGMAKKPF